MWMVEERTAPRVEKGRASLQANRVLIDPCSRLARERRAWPGSWRLKVQLYRRSDQIRRDETRRDATSPTVSEIHDALPLCCRRRRGAGQGAQLSPAHPAPHDAAPVTKRRRLARSALAVPFRKPADGRYQSIRRPWLRLAMARNGSHLTQRLLISCRLKRLGTKTMQKANSIVAPQRQHAPRNLRICITTIRTRAPRLDPSSHVSSLLRASLFAAVAKTREP
jgi:hypothetical protein